MLGQAQIARYLDKCEDSAIAIEEVLSAYIVWKYIKGATSLRVLHKLRHLCIYLRVTGRGHILETGRNAFRDLTHEVTIGGGRVGGSPTGSEPGRQAWNQLRRGAASRHIILMTGDGGSGPVSAFLTENQRVPFIERRTEWGESGVLPGRPQREPPEVPAPEYATALDRDTGLPLYSHGDFPLIHSVTT